MEFKETSGLKKDSDFRNVYKKGNSYANKYLVMYILKNDLSHSRVGISVSKKVGNAIVRNKTRRRIKEAFRLNIDESIKRGYDIIFIARVNIKDVDYKAVEKAIIHLAKKTNMIEKQ